MNDKLSSTGEPNPLLKVNKELGTLKSELSGLRPDFNTTIQKFESEISELRTEVNNKLRTDFNTTIQKVEVRSVKNQIELYNIREKLKKVDAKQLSTDDLSALMRNLPPENDSYVLRSFFDHQQTLQINVNDAIASSMNSNSMTTK